MARRKQPEPLGPATGDDVILFIETFCYVPSGAFAGQPLRLQAWQKKTIRRIYDNPSGPTRRAIVSMGRKNSKSTLAACLLLNHLVGPSARNMPNSELYSAAQSRDQAGIIFKIACQMIRMNPVLGDAVKIQESAKGLRCDELGTRYRALSADAPTAHGLNPSFIIHDELGLVRGPTSSLFSALETATGAQATPLSLIISTQSASDSDLLSILIDAAETGDDPSTVLVLYTAPPELDPFSIEAIRAANPAFGTFLLERSVMAQADDAKRMASREPAYRNLVLNQRVESGAPFVSPSIWKGCGGPPIDFRGKACFCGIDLSSVNDLTSLVLAHRDAGGTWHIKPYFWLPSEGLAERARLDHTRYVEWRDMGLLETTNGASVSYEFVAGRVREIFAEYEVTKAAFDPWGWKHFRDELKRAGFSERMIEQTFVEYRQGTVTMTPALRATEGLLLERKIRHGNHPVLSMCFANAVVEGDDSARRLSKKRSSGRIDGAVAMVMAIGVAPAGTTTPFDVQAMIG
jgi:phage terminase large subunit-like protein